MGKRKAAKKVQGPKKREPLATVFPCLFCNHEKSCNVTLDKKTMIGNLICKVCGQGNSCEINYLSAAVDVYADWVDKCDEAARLHREEQASRFPPVRNTTQSTRARTTTAAASRRRDEDEDLDAEGEDDDYGVGMGSGGGGYSGEGIVQDDDY